MPIIITFYGLFPLRIYTALKQISRSSFNACSLFPLRIYTALKHVRAIAITCSRLFPLRIYTALKQCGSIFAGVIGLFPLRIYTALKLKPQIAREKYLRNICVTSLVFFGNTFILT